MRAVAREKTGGAHDRRGAALVVAIVCTVLVTLMLGTVLKISITRNRNIRHHERALQAAWLAEAGLERARGQLAAQPDYAGETWNIDADSLEGTHGAVVTITVAVVKENPQARTVDVQADYPAELPQRVRTSKRVIMNLTESSPAETGDDT